MTAYAVAPVFDHGDYPVAANMNKISNGQKHIYERAPGYKRNQVIRGLTVGGDETVYFRHIHRWLNYKSTGQIVDPAGIEDDVDLPNPTDDWINTYDLDSVAWLAYGAIYAVTGIDFVCEQANP